VDADGVEHGVGDDGRSRDARRLTQAELDRMFEGTVDDYDRKVEQGIIKVEIYTGRGQQLVNQVREAFGAQG
jgi:hypothetical protein